MPCGSPLPRGSESQDRMRRRVSPHPRLRGIMSHSVLKHWMRSGLGLVAGVAVAVGCGTKESTGPAADYTLSLAPAALTLVQGANGTATVTITRTNFAGAVTLSLGGAPTGVTGSFNPAAPTGTSATLTVSVGAAVAAGVYDLTVAGAGSAGNRSTPLTLTVNAAPDYALSVAPTALTIAQGANGTTTVTITRTSFTDAVTLSLGNAPTGVTGSFNPAAPTGTNSTLTVSVGAAVAPGVYNLTVDGTATAGNRSTPLTLTVSAAPDYSLSLAPAALTIAQAANGTATVTITRTNFTGAVTLSLGGAPARAGSDRQRNGHDHPRKLHWRRDLESRQRPRWGHGGVQPGCAHGNELYAHGERGSRSGARGLQLDGGRHRDPWQPLDAAHAHGERGARLHAVAFTDGGARYRTGRDRHYNGHDHPHQLHRRGHAESGQRARRRHGVVRSRDTYGHQLHAHGGRRCGRDARGLQLDGGRDGHTGHPIDAAHADRERSRGLRAVGRPRCAHDRPGRGRQYD